MAGVDKVQEACEKLLAMFESGELPPAVARTTIRSLGGEAPSASWSLGNQLLMLLAGTEDARGYRQWEAVGRQVRKGARAFYILAPCTRKVKEETADGETVERIVITGFRGVPVFRYEDTEGEPLPQPDYAPPELPPLAEVAERYGVRVRYAPFTRRFYGFYRPSAQEITLCTHDVDTFFHELAHAVHGTFRPLKGGRDAGQEIVAETVAAVLCEMYGFTGYIWHGYEYIRSYARAADGRATVKAVMKVLGDVQKVLHAILGGATGGGVEDVRRDAVLAG